MANLKNFTFLFLFLCTIFSCAENENAVKSELFPQNDEILGKSVNLSNLSYGTKPTSSVYHTTHYKGLINNGIDNIVNTFQLSNDSEHNKWMVFYSRNESYTDKFDIKTEDIEGMGICYLSEGKYLLDLFQNNSDNLDLIKTIEVTGEFPMRTVDHFMPYLEGDNNINSIIFIANNMQGKTLKQVPTGEFNTIIQEILSPKTGATVRSDCGCQSQPCCDVEGCGFREENTYCGWRDGLWVCVECSVCGLTSGFSTNAICTNENGINNEDTFISESYDIKDNLLNTNPTLENYADMYYQIWSLVNSEELFALNSCFKNAKFALETLNAAKRLKDGPDDIIVITDDYYSRVMNLLPQYEAHFDTNEPFIEILDKIAFDTEKYHGWTKAEIWEEL